MVSILIPAFNAEGWIADTLKSALRQTWARKEIIVVDDGSRDRTLSVAQHFASRTVFVVTQPNQGAASARNHALALSQGDYIQWLDADDLLAPDKVEKQMEALACCPGDRRLLSSAWGYFVWRPSRTKFVQTALWCDLTPVEWLLRKLEGNLFMQPATWLVSRKLTEAAGPWDTRLPYDDDGEYFCRVILASDGVRFVPEAKVFYRRPAGNNVSYIGLSNRKIEALFLSMRLHVGYLCSLEDSPRVRRACLNYLQRGLIFFHPERPDLVEAAARLASTLGGELEFPRLSWKYSWIQKVFGWSAAKQTQLNYNQCKSFLVRKWDRVLFEMERTGVAKRQSTRIVDEE
jgi:glycosyltransferase involved in cell wall biosynthesis